MKRVTDIILAFGAILALLPLVLLIALIILLTMGWPVLFTQQRPGRDGVPFRILKFRTMTSATAADGTPLPDDKRLTRFGRFLRRTSLDELPELVNVLRGDMSLVGPRPLLTEYLPLYSPRQARRHEVRPGLTGWAQVNGRNSLSWEDKFELDVWYVDNRNMRLDCLILWRSLRLVLSGHGVNQPGHATAERFRGTVE